jgi:phospholipid/cholesterol/gamma-HCH transport system permease protein
MMGTKKELPAGLELRGEGADLVLVLSGAWLLSQERPAFEKIEESLGVEGDFSALRFDVGSLETWDTALLTFVRGCLNLAKARQMDCVLDDLPANVQNIIDLSLAVPEQKMISDMEASDNLSLVGEAAIRVCAGVQNYFDFIGQLLLDFVALFTGRARLRLKDFLFLLQSTGAQALPIVCLLSFLTGLIIAFIGVIQLQKFAADIYVADLVGLAITRELGAVMAGVIMAGRTGAAFAAQIGSMRVNDEVDALVGFGISPMQFLVLPRVLALVLMMPLLCVCADFVAIVGGMVVAVAISDVSIVQYCNQVQQAVEMNDFLGGIFKSSVFGVIIALAGCYRGLNCGKDATSVGLAATSAVVTSITWIVVADAVFAVLFHILKI